MLCGAGEQGAELLPVLLKPGGLGSLTKDDRKRLRSKVCLSAAPACIAGPFAQFNHPG